MATEFDYAGYGAFKRLHAEPTSLARRAAACIGLRNRYVRFVENWPRQSLIVELGCGDGAFIDVMRSEGFRHVEGVELSPSYCPRQDVHQESAADFLARVGDGEIGGIVAFDLFEHIEATKLRELLKLAHTKLAGGGQLVFRVPNAGSPLGLMNQAGDQSHVSFFNEVSIRQLAFDSGFPPPEISPEPLSYPRSPSAVLGLFAWPLYRLILRAVLAAFGQRVEVLTPNIICTLTKQG